MQSMAIRFLVVEDDEDIREIISSHLEEEFGAFVELASSGNEAIEKLKSGLNVDCVVSDYTMANGTGGTLFLYIKKSAPKIPFILCTANDPKTLAEFKTSPPDFFVEKPFITGPLSEVVKKLSFSKEPLKQKVLEYFSIKPKSLLRVGLLPTPIYLKLSEDKYVKILNAGDCFNADDFHKYSLKNVESFYLLNSDREAFFHHWLADLDKLGVAENTPPSEFDRLAVRNLQNIYLLIGELGAHPEIQKKMLSAAVLSIRTVCAEPSLFACMKRMLDDPEHYVPMHSLSVGHIACALANLMGWSSEITFLKLQMAAMLHDVTLDTQNLVRVKCLDELEADVATMTAAELSFFKTHPYQAAVLIQEFKQLPADVDVIVRQHHELPDGSGFPEGLQHQKISPLSSVFILAHRLYSFSTNRNSPEDSEMISEFVKALPPSFQVGEFKKIIHALVKAT